MSHSAKANVLASKPKNRKEGSPKALLSVSDAIFIIVGVVVGAGIFRAPSVVAAQTGTVELFLGVWFVGGLMSLIGALCYAELSTAYPNAGGDYYFLRRAYGRPFAFLFGWARMSVIQTGSIALLAYIVGDYVSQLYDLGSYSSAIYAALVVICLTVINIVGVVFGARTQKVLVAIQFLGLFLIILAGLFLQPSDTLLNDIGQGSVSTSTSIGLAMVFVLLTFGGWNEAGYISAELRGGSRRMVPVLIGSIALITGIYMLINLAYIHVLGIDRIAASDAPAVDLMRVTLGEIGVVLMGLLVAIAALTSLNATILTGARTNYALGKDFKLFSWLSHWSTHNSAPLNALVVQAVIALLLILIGTQARSGFETMVELTAPVFWFFFLCTGISLFVLRQRDPGTPRPFKVPLYPLTPILFCAICGYLLYSSLVYTGKGAWVGIAILVVGFIFHLVFRRGQDK